MALRIFSSRLAQVGQPMRVVCARAPMSSSSSSSPSSSSDSENLPAKRKPAARSWLEVGDEGRVAPINTKDELMQAEELRSQRPLLYHEQMEWLDDRLVRISKPSKNVMQSGTAYTNTWKIEFNSQERFEYWLMGWTGTADPVSNLSLNFPTKDDAIAFCEKNQLPWYVEEQPERKIRRKSYAENFSWNKRMRTTNK